MVVSRFAVSSALTLSMVLAAPILAQTAAGTGATQAKANAGDTSPSDIIVTARRVEERLQDVPISITVFSQQQITNKNISQSADLANFTPSLSANNNTGSQNSTFAIRGFVQEPATQPSVGVYFADVVAPRGSASSQSSGDGAGPGAFFDLQNVQVLKGPQGTLFGRNTTGGAILLVPQKPTRRFEGYIEGSYGNFDMKRIQGVINVPLNETMRIRIGVDHQSRDGYAKNDTGIGPSRFSDINYTAVRGSIVADLTPSLENYTIVSYSRSDTNGDVKKLVAAGSGTLAGAAALFAPLAQAQLNREAAKGADFYTVQSSLDRTRTLLDQWQIVNTTTWRASDRLTVKNIISYAQLKQFLITPLFGTNFQFGTGVLNFAAAVTAPGAEFADQSTFTEEFQLQGSMERLKWQAGAYMEISDPLSTIRARSPGTGLSCSDYQNLICTNPLSFGTVSNLSYRTEFRNYGIYAQGTYSLTEQLAITGGVRYTRDRGFSTIDVQTLNLVSPGVTSFRSCPNPDANPTAPNCTSTYRTRSQKPTWLIDLDYKPTDDVLLYAKWTRGYRAGGIANTAPTPAAVFFPEKVDSYEVGAKTQFGGPLRATFNVSGFYNDFTNQQIRYNLYPSNATVTQASAVANAGKSRIYGAEVEASVTPVTGLRFDVSYAYINAKIRNFALPALPASSPYNTGSQQVFKGDPLPLTPKNKVAATVTYTLPLDASAGSVSVSGTLVHTDKQLTNYVYRDAANKLYGLSYVGGRDLVNLNLNWNSVFGSRFDVSAFVTNLTKKKYYDYSVGLGTNVLGFEAERVGEPRMFGGRVRYRFGG